MYDTRFAFAPLIDIDCSVITEIYKNEVPADAMPVFRYDISRSPYLTGIAKQYPWLAQTLDFFIIVAGGFISIHYDSADDDEYRAAVLNLPVLNTEQTHTSWHEMPEGTEWVDPWPGNGKFIYTGGKAIWAKAASVVGPPVTLFSTTTAEPIIFNAKFPHSVKNKGFNRRVIASWHTKFKNYDEAKTFFSVT